MSKHHTTLFISILFFISLVCVLNTTGQPVINSSKHNNKIQTALLLDISGSMDGLLKQTKLQFWNTVNYINSASKDQRKPDVEFALITYGGDGIENNQENYINRMSNLTIELDSVADQLYEIRIGGSLEYCWTAIQFALDSLTWSANKNDLRLIIIAGNESFNQGPKVSSEVLKKSRKQGVIINTIYCGSEKDSTCNSWIDAAKLAKGKFSSINISDSTNTKETSLDHKLIEFNNKLNSTYIPFGPTGQRGLKRLMQQDKNAEMSGMPIFRERIVFKATDHFKNATWELVDAFVQDSTVIEKLPMDGFPEEMRKLNLFQRKEYLKDTRFRRENYRSAITMRQERIRKYLGDTQKNETLDKSIKLILEEEGKKKGFVFK